MKGTRTPDAIQESRSHLVQPINLMPTQRGAHVANYSHTEIELMNYEALIPRVQVQLH